MIQILNHLLLDSINFINEKIKELCANVIILHVFIIDRVHGYWFCLLVLIETVPFTRVNVTALVLVLYLKH